MTDAVLFKILQRRYKFRNPKGLLKAPEDIEFQQSEIDSAIEYISTLRKMGISYTCPTDQNYPKQFRMMKEPPLFLEYSGTPFWNEHGFISVVGSRQISDLTELWMKNHLPLFLNSSNAGIVSGGAIGVDQLAHSICIFHQKHTIVVLPSGIRRLYPENLGKMQQHSNYICLLSEFERDERVQKSHFYFRNRLIAALGKMTLVTQATLKSGSLHTVHHALEFGRPVLTVPSHPELTGFEGNIQLMSDGAYEVPNSRVLLDYWNSEN